MKRTTLTVEEEKPRPAKWWHWFIEWCPKCEYNASQGPVQDDVGEDCCLFEKVDAYKQDQRAEPPAYVCTCGTKLEPRYRHALADNNLLEDANGKQSKAPLLPGQPHGEIMKAVEYEMIKKGLMKPNWV